MQIVEPTRRVRPVPKPLNPYLTIDPDAPDEAGEVAVLVTETVTATSVEIVAGSDAPQSSETTANAPSPRRNDQRHQRRQRDRRHDPPRPSQNAPIAGDAVTAAPPPMPPVHPPADKTPDHQTQNDQTPNDQTLGPSLLPPGP